MGSGQMITLCPEELTFPFELDKQSYCDLKVVNNTEYHVAFKVKTTSPKKYFVRPNTGIVQPWDNCVITVTLQAQHEYPPDMQCKDKFLLQSTNVPPTTDVDDIPPETFSKDGSDKVIEECKLRVVYTYPPHANSTKSEDDALLDMRSSRRSFDTNTMLSSSMFDEIHALRLAKEERDAAIQQTKQLQRQLELLKRRRNRTFEAGFSITFASFVGLIGIMVGLLLNLALTSPPTE